MFGINCKLQSGVDEVSAMVNDLLALTKKQVLVGVPEENDPRETGDGIGNASLAYIHDNGSPLANIPARPFMKPGIAKAQDRINDQLFAAAKAQMNDQPEEVDIRLNRAGLIAQSSIKGVINQGEGFEPLKRATKLARLRRRKAASKWDKNKREEVMDSMTPLRDTGALLNSIMYVVEEKD